MKHTIILPDLGQTTSEAKVLKWHKRPGELISAGEPLVEVETDKATMDVEAYIGGYVRATLVEEGQMATAKDPIAILTDTAEEAYEDKPEVLKEAPTVESRAVKVETPSPKKTGGAVAAMPAARTLAKELGVDLNQVQGTGPNGLITVKDVRYHAIETEVKHQAPAAAPVLPGALSAMAAITASSKATIPHFYVTVDVDVSAAVAWRGQWNSSHPNLSASFNDIFVRAASRALIDSPQVNIAFRDGKYEPKSSGDTVLVVGNDGKLNLVPVKDLSSASWDEFLTVIRNVLDTAREGRIVGQGAVSPLLAISNLGMFCVREFAAIIRPGCTAVLAIGSIRDQVVLRDGRVESVKICSLTLSADHRVVDGIGAAKFLERIQVHLNSL